MLLHEMETDVLIARMKTLPACIGRYIFQYIIGDAQALRFEGRSRGPLSLMYEKAMEFDKDGWSFCRILDCQQQQQQYYMCRYVSVISCDACGSTNCCSDFCGALSIDHKLVAKPLIRTTQTMQCKYIGETGIEKRNESIDCIDRALLEYHLLTTKDMMEDV
jgi:hypothetical protein